MPRLPPSPEHLPSAPSGARAGLRWLGLLVLVAAVIPFLPAVRQGFVLGDDGYNLIQNPNWHGLGARHLRWMWTTPHVGHWHPLTWMSFGLEYALWGVNAERMHAVNLGLHAIGALLLFLLMRRLVAAALGARAEGRGTAIDLAAALAAIFWAVHPLRVESVVWATERRDLLSGLFLIATVLAWLRWVAGEGRGWLAVTLLLYVLSLLSKAWGMTLPALLLVLDLYPLRRLALAGGGARGLARLTLEKLPFLPLAIATAAIAAWAQSSGLATLSLAEHGVVARIAQGAYGLLFYPWKTLVPAQLSTLYLLEVPLDPTRAIYVLSLIGVVAISTAAWVLRRRWPAFGAAWLAYAVLVSPVLGVLQSGGQKVADRYGYLALIPLCALLAGGLQALLVERRRRAVGAGVGALVLVVLGGLSWRQTRVWKDSETLWGQAVAREPDNYVALLNLATAHWERALLLRSQREPQQAQLEGKQARKLVHRSIEAEPGPRNVYARCFLGATWLEQGDFERALQIWREALAIDPADTATLSIATGELLRRGRKAEALQLLEAGHAAAPDDEAVAEMLRQLQPAGVQGR